MRFALLLLLWGIAVTACWGQDTILFNGNYLVTSMPESVSVADPVTGNIIRKTTPVKCVFLNGEKIYSRMELDAPPTISNKQGNGSKLSEYIFQSAKSKLQLLPDGMYVLDIANPVIDKHGHLVYYKMNGIKQIMIPRTPSKASKKKLVYTEFITGDWSIPPKTKNEINEVVNSTLLHFPIITPAQLHNNPVNATGYLFSLEHYILVENHIAKNVDDYFSL